MELTLFLHKLNACKFSFSQVIPFYRVIKLHIVHNSFLFMSGY